MREAICTRQILQTNTVLAKNVQHACVLLFLVVGVTPRSVTVSCGPGEFLVPGVGGRRDTCQPCLPGEYQDLQYHRETFCKMCSPFNEFDPRLVFEDECTSTHDTIISCVPGFYLAREECLCCTDCALLGMVQGLACQRDQDTVCRARLRAW